MVYDFKLPDVGEGIAEGEIVKWFVTKGEKIDEDQPIAEVQTDKALIEITSPVSGTVKDILFEEGAIVEVNSVIISFLTEVQNEQASSVKVINAGGELVNRTESTDFPGIQTGQKEKKNRPITTPTIRRMARELNIDLSLIKGSGKNGRIIEEDLRRYQESLKLPEQIETEKQASATNYTTTPQAPTDNQNIIERIPLRGLRRSISKKMTQSTQFAAQSTIVEEVNVSNLVTIRKQMSENAIEKGIHLTYLPFILKAVQSALKEFPFLNASINEETEQILLKKFYNIGIATDTDKGLIVPVIKQADQKNLLELAKEITTLSDKARSNRLTVEDLAEGTFTITNIGSTGVGLFGTPIINYPESAILGIHRIQKKPCVINDEIVISEIMGVSLSFDHRLIDGAMASYFLKHIISYLENPHLLFMEMV